MVRKTSPHVSVACNCCLLERGVQLQNTTHGHVATDSKISHSPVHLRPRNPHFPAQRITPPVPLSLRKKWLSVHNGCSLMSPTHSPSILPTHRPQNTALLSPYNPTYPILTPHQPRQRPSLVQRLHALHLPHNLHLQPKRHPRPRHRHRRTRHQTRTPSLRPLKPRPPHPHQRPTRPVRPVQCHRPPGSRRLQCYHRQPGRHVVQGQYYDEPGQDGWIL